MTPAIKLLQRERVAFTEHPYEHSSGADSYGLEAAEKLGVDPERVYKTLVCQAEGVGLVMVMVPVTGKVDLKKLARALGVKKAEMADAGAAERTTGYVLGGISPLGGRRPLPVVVDHTLPEHETIFCSAGRRGLQIELAPADLMRLTKATSAEVAS